MKKTQQAQIYPPYKYHLCTSLICNVNEFLELNLGTAQTVMLRPFEGLQHCYSQTYKSPD